MKAVWRDIWWWLKRAPATTLLLITSLVAGIYTKALWVSADSLALTQRLGWGLPAFRTGDYLSIFSGLLIAPAPWMYILILVPLAVGGGYIEHKYGTLRMLVALMATHVGAVFGVALLLLALQPSGLAWVHELSLVRDVGLSNAGFGMLGAATAALATVWRRRVRLVLVIYCLAFILYSGFIWDMTHFAALLVGFAIGPWVVRRSYRFTALHWQDDEVRGLSALLLIFVVFTQLVSKLYPGNGGLLAFDNPDPAVAGGMLYTVGLSIFLLLLAYGLYAGRRFAWRLSVASFILLLVGYAVLPLSGASDRFDLAVLLGMLALLIGFRRAFQVSADHLVRRRVYQRLLLLAGGLLVFNALAIYAIRTSFQPVPSFHAAVAESLYQIVGVSTRSFLPATSTARFLTDSISLVWLGAVLLGVGTLIFTTYRGRDDRGSFDDYDALLRGRGGSTIGWMARWPGMRYWVNASKTAGFAYRLENNFAIVLSDPVGSRQAVAAAFGGFEAMCARRGWHPIYYAVTDNFRRRVSKQRLKNIQVGEDTIIDLAPLTFSGKSWQSIRSSLNRAAKDGIRMRAIKFCEAPVGLRDQLRSIAAGWSSDKSLPEMGFTLGTLQEAEDPEVRMHIAVDEAGTVHGMSSWLPVYKNGQVVGWTIDIMQRRLHKDTMPGVMEFLIAESATAFKQEGYQFISLSAAPLSHSGKATNAIEQLLDVVAKRMEPYYGFQSLYNYKQKFRPRHEPLYLCYHDEARLPAIALAIGKAYMPDHTVRELLAAKVRPPSSTPKAK